jgi:hypothetical protein
LKNIDDIARTGHSEESMANPSLVIGHGFKDNS